MTEKQSIGRDKAIELAETHWWESCSHREIAQFQLCVEELCCPFSVFRAAIEKSLGRPVYTHEIALNYGGLAAELFGEKGPPTLNEIIAMIPAEKRLIVDGVGFSTEED